MLAEILICGFGVTLIVAVAVVLIKIILKEGGVNMKKPIEDYKYQTVSDIALADLRKRMDRLEVENEMLKRKIAGLEEKIMYCEKIVTCDDK